MRILRGLRALFKFLRSGCAKVVAEERKARLAACHWCPEIRDKGRFETCATCGCYVRLKTWCATEDCPNNYWPKRTVWVKMRRK